MRRSTDRKTTPKVGPCPRLVPGREPELQRGDDGASYMVGVLKRTHGGRWPTFRALATVQIGSTLYEAAQWRPNRRANARHYSVLTWNLGELALSWVDYRSARAARQALAALREEIAVQQDAVL